MGVIPFVILIFLNISILKKLTARKRWEEDGIRKNQPIKFHLENSVSSDKAEFKERGLESKKEGSDEHELAQPESSVIKRGLSEKNDLRVNGVNDSDDFICICECNEHPTNSTSCSNTTQQENRKQEVTLEILPLVTDTKAEAKDNDLTPTKKHRLRIHGGRSTGKNVVHLAWVTLAIVFVFIICHIIRWIPNFYEMMTVKRIQYFMINLSKLKKMFVY